MNKIFGLLCLLVLLCTAGFAQANLITNGDFETLPSTINSGSWTIYSSLPGWTLYTGEAEIQHGMFGTNNPTNYTELDANRNVRMGQSVSLTKGATYQLSFDYFNRQQSTASGSMAVSIGGFTYETAALGPKWATLTTSFVYTGASPSAILYLSGTGVSDSYGALVDNISLVQTKPAPTPVPGAVCARLGPARAFGLQAQAPGLDSPSTWTARAGSATAPPFFVCPGRANRVARTGWQTA